MKSALLIIAALHILQPKLYSQDVRDSSKISVDTTQKKNNKAIDLYPNIAGKALMTPAGWSANGKFIFVGLGGTYPQVYSTFPDLIASAGFGFGDSYKSVSFVTVINVNDVSEFDNFSLSLLATHTFPKGSTVGAGALHLLANPNKTDAPPSLYIRYSHTVQNVPSIIPGYSRMNYTVGIGSGRFAKNSEKDIAAGKSKYGTAVFANISYEIIKNVNVNVEWSGVNLCLTMGVRPWYKLPAISFGVADLTRYSGDKPRFVFGVSYTFYLPDKKI